MRTRSDVLTESRDRAFRPRRYRAGDAEDRRALEALRRRGGDLDLRIHDHFGEALLELVRTRLSGAGASEVERQHAAAP